MAEAKVGSRREAALRAALDIRKFEIELYWRRAAYFWTFIRLSRGMALRQTLSDEVLKSHLSVAVSVLGFVFPLMVLRESRKQAMAGELGEPSRLCSRMTS